MNEGSSLLIYAIRGPVVLKYVAQLILVQAGLFLLPVAIALFYAEYEFALRFVAIACVLAITALPFSSFGLYLTPKKNQVLQCKIMIDCKT